MVDFSKITQHDIESLGEDGLSISQYNDFIIIKDYPRTFSMYIYKNGDVFVNETMKIWQLMNMYAFIRKISE